MRIRLLRYALLLIALSVVAVALSLSIWPREVRTGPGFEKLPLILNDYDWFDAGVVDIDSDGRLDLYTANHDARQSLLLGSGDGRFVDALTSLAFDHDAAFPGLEDKDAPMLFPRGGLYLFYRDGNLHISSVARDGFSGDVSGSISVSSAIEVKRKSRAEITVESREIGRGVFQSELEFRIAPSGSAELSIPYKAVPMRIELGTGAPLQSVFVGRQMVNPKKSAFVLNLRDRHGIAWTDLNGDTILDAYVTRGGLNGKVRQFPDRIENELLLSDGRRFDRAATELGLDDSACPARQTQWVDVDADGDLDLYLVCGRQTGGFWEYVPGFLRRRSAAEESGYPNRLYVRTADGRFEDLADEFGLAFPDGGMAAWLDADDDGDADLLWASEQGIALYRNGASRFEAEPIDPPTATQVRKFALADYDSDGDLDVFAVAAIGSRVLRNTDGAFESLDPDSLGLPGRSKTATWLDFDNDGRIDFYAWPQGLFLQADSPVADSKFVARKTLTMSSPWSVLMDARALWFDFDTDGDLDVLIMQRYFPHAVQQLSPRIFPFTGALYENTSARDGHWAQVDLSGTSGNSEAIGARVSVETATASQHRWIGQHESAHYSQGHYRTYFGLGDDAGPVRVTVRWTDGAQTRHEVSADALTLLSDEGPDE